MMRFGFGSNGQRIGYVFLGAIAVYAQSAPATAAADADVTVTTRTDSDGYQIRPPHVTILHATDSARNADLTGPDRTALDRYRVRSSRAGRSPVAGHTMRIMLQNSRAGERPAWRGIRVTVSAFDGRSRLTTNTTGRTDAAGYALRVPSIYAACVADSKLLSALSSTGATDRDRNTVRPTLPTSGMIGDTFRVMLLTDGHAGNRPAWRGFKIDVAEAGEAAMQKARSV